MLKRWVQWGHDIFYGVFHRLLSPEAELQELTCILYSVIWGAILIYVDEALKESVVFARLKMLGSDDAWGMFFCGFGVLGLWAYTRDYVLVRRAMAMGGVLVWSLVTVLLYWDFRPVIGVVVVPVCALMSMLTYIRLGYRKNTL